MTTTRLAVAAAFMTVGFLVAPHSSLAGEPGDQLNDGIQRVFASLRDPDLKPASKEAERRLAVRRIVDELFDFEETARRSLGRHWQSRSMDEQQQFVRLFTELIDRAYLRRVDRYDGEQVVILSDAVDGNQAVVDTRIITRDKSEIPVEYLMHRTGADRWRVWDVKIAGMSLVASYRAQFNKIIHAESYGDLVQRMRAKATP
ncbi:MAG: ABC transporter substrate-binding protein [Candidatus Rokuibacteriota bacterium]